MFVEIPVALFCILIQPTIHHYIGDLDDCTASKVCNHTWVPVCGHNEVDSSYRLFLDSCDLHEYNCDNNKSYVEVDVKVCGEKCTQKDQAHVATTPMASTTPNTEVSTIMTTEETSTETPYITSTTAVTETSTDKTDTSTIFVAPSTVEVTTEEATSSTPRTSETTKVTKITTDATVTSTNIYNLSTKSVTETITVAAKLPSKSDDENTIPEENNQYRTFATTPKGKCYPKHCSMPSTWETTSVGETRDFVQILRERYGNRIKFLRHTTHFPKKAVYARKSGIFIPGRHLERRRRLLF